MRVMNLNDKELYSELLKYHKRKSLIPLLGAGFTRGALAKNGIVPNGKEMTDEMMRILEDVLDPSDMNLIQNSKFSEVSEAFFENADENKIYKFLSNSFTEVILEMTKKKFINLNWSHIYTLNIDDGIEGNHNNLEVIYPFKKISEFYDENKLNKTHLYKLHGDAKEYVRHGEKCILSTTSYLQSLQENRELLSRLISDIKSNCIIYIGCSLEDELDILYQIGLEQQSSNLKNTYYVTSNTEITNSKLKIQKLKKFGVDTIIHVEDYNDLYRLLEKVDLDSTKFSEEEMDRFVNPKFLRIGKGHFNKSSNMEFMENTNKPFEKFDEKIIELPHYLVDREIINNANKIDENIFSKNIVIFQGHRFSGKTSVLLTIAEKLHNQNIIFIPSGNKINEEFFLKLLKLNDYIVFLDTGVLDFSFWSILKARANKLESQKLRFIIAVDSSDEFLYKIELLIENEEFQDFIGLCTLKNNFTKTETDEINSKLVACVIPEFKYSINIKKNFKNERVKLREYRLTLLDNIYDVLSKQNSQITLKSIKQLDIDESKLIVLILLASKQRLTFKEIEKYRLSKTIHSFIDELSPIAHFYHTLRLEKDNNDYSGLKLICNSRAWILYNLGEFAVDKVNQELIAKAYRILIETILYHHKQNPKKARDEVGQFIKFDDINDIFPRKNKGTLSLIHKIYSNLEDILEDNYHFPHQRAKSLSWLDNLEELNKATDYAQVALSKIENAFSTNYESNYSYMHIWYTLATINTKIVNLNNFKDEKANRITLAMVSKALSYKENLNYLMNDVRSNSAKNIREFIHKISFEMDLSKNEKAEINSLIALIK